MDCLGSRNCRMYVDWMGRWRQTEGGGMRTGVWAESCHG